MEEELDGATHEEDRVVVDTAPHIGRVRPITMNGGRSMAMTLGIEMRDRGIQGVTIVEVDGSITITSLTEESREEVKKVLREKAFQ